MLQFLQLYCLVQVPEVFFDNSKGFASLEAKRKFRAPRSSPDDSSPISSSSLSPDENASVDDAVGKTNFSDSSLSPDENVSVDDAVGKTNFSDSSLSPDDHVSVDDVVCKTNYSESFLLYAGNIGNALPRDSVSFIYGCDYIPVEHFLLSNCPYKYCDVINCSCFLQVEESFSPDVHDLSESPNDGKDSIFPQ